MTDPISNERPEFKVETAFADHRIEHGLEPLPNIHIAGPNGFRAEFRDTPENRATANVLVDAWNRRQSPAGVEVKGLEWTVSEVFGRRKVRGSGPFGEVCAFTIDDLSDQEIADKKSAYEADYERRILSSLSVKEPEGVELCATDGCDNAATEYFEAGGVGSRYCKDCAAKISVLAQSPPKVVTISDDMVNEALSVWRDYEFSEPPVRDFSRMRAALTATLSSEAHNG